MNKFMLLVTLLLLSLTITEAKAQTTETTEVKESNLIVPKNSLRLDINTMGPDQTSIINDFIATHRKERGFWLSMGKALLGSFAGNSSNIAINEIVRLTQINKIHRDEWNQMIWNECSFVDSLTYINNLTDFYSEGSYNGALDPADLRFNGFTLNAQRDGKDVLRFYCHVDIEDAGLLEIYNHSKFHLVLDSMYFYPYRCHLPNFSANQIYLEEGKQYNRSTSFSFEERDNLMVNLNFVISSSWYNEAIILAKDVELGEFNVQVPIEKNRLTDSVYVYKKGMRGMDTLNMSGSCFIVPRSYMPLPGGVAHWGTGEYNVKVTVSEQCDISNSIKENWKKDYQCLKRMKKENKAKDYFINLYNQNGTTVMRSLLETASKTAREQAGLK